MDRERDHPPSSEERLRAAREEARSPGHHCAASDGGGQSRAGRPAPEASGARAEDGASRPVAAERMIARTARLVPVGGVLGRLKRNEFSLVVDEGPAARVYTERKPNGIGLRGAAFLRETRVYFLDDDRICWRIDAEEPGKRAVRTTRFGREKEVPFRVSERRVFVETEPIFGIRGIGGEVRRLAQTEGRFAPGRRGEVGATSAGTSYALRPAVKARRGTVGTGASISRDGPWPGSWTVHTTSRLPLSIALLHWHILIGDYTVPSASP